MVAATLTDALRHDIHEERKMASVKQENCANGLKKAYDVIVVGGVLRVQYSPHV